MIIGVDRYDEMVTKVFRSYPDRDALIDAFQWWRIGMD
jgi:hypothetical protein